MTNPFALDNAPAAQPAATATVTTPTAAPVAQPAPAAAPAADPFGGDDPFSGPAPQLPRGPRLRDMYGRLLLIIPHKLEEGLPNRLQVGTTQDRMTADVIILDGDPIHFGGAPEKVPPKPHTQFAPIPHKNARMFISSVGLISQCRDALAQKVSRGRPGMVLGRLGVGEAKDEGQNAPYVLSPPTDADKVLARQYLATQDPFA